MAHARDGYVKPLGGGHKNMQLTKGIFDRSVPRGEQPLFGLSTSQMRGNEIVHNGGWYNLAGGGNLPPPVESKPAVKLKSGPLTRAQKLVRALKACKSMRNRKKRASCQATARRRYGAEASNASHRARAAR